MDWMKRFSRETFGDYWKKYKECDPQQKIVRLSLILGTKSPEFLSELRAKIEEQVGMDLEDWLSKNRIVGLYKLLE
jgi:hypothetical protein